MSTFALTNQSGSSSPSSGSSSPSSTASSATSTTSTDSALRRIYSRLARSSRRKLESIGLRTPQDSSDRLSSGDEFATTDDLLLPRSGTTPTHSRQTSGSPTRSNGVKGTSSSLSDQSSGVSFMEKQHSLRRVQSERADMLKKKAPSLLSFTTDFSVTVATAQQGPRPAPVKAQFSWCAGPTKSAKEGIVREWAQLQGHGEELAWNNQERELGASQDPRELGRRLLFTQLEALMPYWAVVDGEGIQEVGEMLVGRWIESGRIRQRVVEWENLVGKQRAEEVCEGREVQRFHFVR
jgi:hypothetical protein